MYSKGLRPSRRQPPSALTAALALVFFYAPNDADQGFVQKIFYIHVPLAIVCAVRLRRGRPVRDQAPAHAATRAGTCAPTSRSTCRSSSASACSSPARSGRKASWGHWWVWDEPTLVSFLIVFLLYCIYQPLRFSIEDPERQARYASVFAITAGAFVPLNFIAVRLAAGLTHPRVLSQTGGDMPGEMRLTFLVSLVGDDAPVHDALEARADLQARVDAAQAAARRRAAPSASAVAARDAGSRAPALPLDEAGKYVAGAYGVFVTLILVYVAIMAAKLARIERELTELADGGRVNGELLALGASHKTAPLALREKLALPDGRAARVLGELTDHEACTRPSRSPPATAPSSTSSPTTPSRPRRGARRSCRARPASGPPSCSARSTRCAGARPCAHLFCVAAGLDSMIVGEAEIQGQVKRAYELALVEGVTGPISNRLFRDALGGRQARAHRDRRSPRSNVSVSSVAVELAADFLGELADRRVLVIGAGENAELTARALRDRGVQTLFVANRRYDRALGLAQRFGGHAVRFDDLPRELRGCRHRRHLAPAPPHQIVGREELELVAALAHGPAAADDRHRRAARHRPERARLPGHHALRHGRPAARGRAQPRRAARPRPRRRSCSCARRSSASRAGSRASTWCRRSRRCASAPTRSCAQVLARTSRAGSRFARPTASASR